MQQRRVTWADLIPSPFMELILAILLSPFHRKGRMSLEDGNTTRRARLSQSNQQLNHPLINSFNNLIIHIILTPYNHTQQTLEL